MLKEAMDDAVIKTIVESLAARWARAITSNPRAERRISGRIKPINPSSNANIPKINMVQPDASRNFMWDVVSFLLNYTRKPFP